MTAQQDTGFRALIMKILPYIKERDYDAALGLLESQADDAWHEDDLVDLAVWKTRMYEMKQEMNSSYTYDHAMAVLERFPGNCRLLLRIAEMEWKRTRDRSLAEERVRAALMVCSAQGAEFRGAKRLLSRIAFSSGDFRAAAQHMLESVPASSQEAQPGPPLLLQEAVQLATCGERRNALEIEDALARAQGVSST